MTGVSFPRLDNYLILAHLSAYLAAMPHCTNQVYSRSCILGTCVNGFPQSQKFTKEIPRAVTDVYGPDGSAVLMTIAVSCSGIMLLNNTYRYRY